MSLIGTLQQTHHTIFNKLNNLTEGWFLGLAARLVFSSVLFFFFINSAMTKLGEGIFGIFQPSLGAYAQIVPPIMESVGYDASQIAFFPWGLIVILGTVAEFVLPVLILLGLGTRLASIAFLGFIAVMTFVDINFHGLEAETIGAFFDRIHNSEVSDLRLMWIFPLLVLILKGPGKISLDHLLSRTIKTDDGQSQTQSVQ